MNLVSRLAVVVFAAVFCGGRAAAAAPVHGDDADFHRWISDVFEGARSDHRPEPDKPTTRMLPTTKIPFSFQYDGMPSVELLATWPLERSSRKLDGERTEYVLAYTDRKTGLVLRCIAVAYHRFPTMEWTLNFKNTGTVDTRILKNIQALDIELERGPEAEFLLHHNIGSPANGSDYGPLETRLGPGATKRLSAVGGRPTNLDWSYFNLEAAGQGMVIVVGWPGQWAAELTRDQTRAIHIRAGQELTHFKLHPGEEVRSPLIVLQAWKGDWIDAQNVWRRWMMAYSLPRPGGTLPPPLMFASTSRQYDEMIHATEENQIQCISRYLEEGLKIDYWWMDAGWYVNQSGWPDVGTWEVDRQRFPHGLRAISDFAHRKGVKTLVWFEPERVSADSWLARNHPAWVLGGAKGGLLNLGLPEAREWLTDHIDRLLTEQGIDLYRQVFNMDPLPFWRAHDARDRQGITEINKPSTK
jgi:alpha-galactosidase